MKRVATAVVLLAALVLGTAASRRHRRERDVDRARREGRQSATTTLTVWVGWSARELSEFKKVAAEYDRKNPSVTVKVVGGINDDKIIAALRGGNAPDVVSSFTSANVGMYCASGGWIDLAPYLKKDGINDEHLPGGDAVLHAVQGQAVRAAAARRRLRPLLQQGAVQEGRAQRARRRRSRELDRVREEADDEERRRLAQGRRLQPVLRLLPEHGRRLSAARERASGSTRRASRASRNDPQWAKLLRWQKSLIDCYGYNNLVKFQAGAGDEFSASNAFETGKLAMNIDGEWRVAFIAAEHPELKYGTAPMPVDDAQPACTAPATSTARSSASRRAPKNKDAAWALVKYLTTNDHALAQFSNGIRNVPSTTSRGEVEGAQAGRELRDVHEDLRATRSRRRRRSPSAGRPTSTRSPTSSRSGRRARSATSQRACRTWTSRSTPSSSSGRRRSVISRRQPGRDVAPALPATDRRRAKRTSGVAPPRPRPRLHEPLARRLLASSSAIRSCTAPTSRSRTTTCSTRRAGSGSRTTATCSRTTRRSGRRSRTRSG